MLCSKLHRQNVLISKPFHIRSRLESTNTLEATALVSGMHHYPKWKPPLYPKWNLHFSSVTRVLVDSRVRRREGQSIRGSISQPEEPLT